MPHDDLPLNRPHQPAPAAPPPSSARWVGVLIAGVAAGALLMFWWMSRAQPNTARPASITATDVAIGSNRPIRRPIDLPAIDASDALIRELVSALSKHPLISRLLVPRGLVRGVTLGVVQIGDGRTPVVPFAALRNGSRVQITGSTSGKVDPRTYTRWDGAVAALQGISPADAAQLYVNVKPLIDQAYIELGHPGEDFDHAIVRAIQMLADTPSVDDAPVLLRRTGYLEHEDATLRALRPVQKQFLLLGPEHRRRVLQWLTEFAKVLDLKLN